MAAQAGQAMQVELLVVNGADPCRLDRLGHTPEECARSAVGILTMRMVARVSSEYHSQRCI